MKTQNALLTLLLLVFLLSACSDDDNNGTFKRLPDEATTFINSYFAGEDIETVEIKTDSDKRNSYYVTLRNQTKLVFDSYGYCSTMESQDGLPEKLISDYIDEKNREEIKIQYPNVSVTKITSAEYGKKVQLSNKQELSLFYGFYTGMVLGKQILSLGELPEVMRLFLTNYIRPAQFSYILKATQSDYTDYQVILSNTAILYFNENGEWHTLDGKSNAAFPKEIYGAMPKAVGDVMLANHSNAVIRQIKKYPEYYAFIIDNSQGVIVSPDGDLLEAPTDIIFDFVRNHFEFNYNIQIRYNSHLLPDEFRYNYSVNLEDRNLTIVADVDGYWMRIVSIYVSGGLTRKRALPATLLDELHPAIKLYLAQHYADKDITDIFRRKNTGQSYIETDGKLLLFDNDGNFEDFVEGIPYE